MAQSGVNIKLVFNKLPQLTAQMKAKADEVVDKTAHNIEARAKESLTGPKSGVIYRRGGATHRASAPGEPPANDQGTLGSSIAVENAGPMRRIVAVGAEHGLVLETGGAKVAPRPFM